MVSDALGRSLPAVVYEALADALGLGRGPRVALSEPIVVEDEQRTLVKVAKELNIDMAMSLDDGRYLFAPRGTWSRR